jgi:hypothetical protein
MGTKDVLYYTRGMAWGADTRLYRTADELRAELPSLLRAGPRVLKQHRGNGGEGVWKAELVRDSSNASEPTVQVQHAVRGATVDTMQLSEFVTRCIPYFANAGSMVDQPYQPRLPEGMIRCYLTQDRVAGFGHQFVTALLPAEAGSGPPDPSPRLYYGAEKVEFQRLRRLLEDGWVAEMRDILGISREALPVIWDADFLLGPRTAADEDTYSLCEINVSSVFPIPDEAVAPLVRTAVDGALASR